MGDLQTIYGFTVVFVAATLLLMAYAEGFDEVEIHYENDDAPENESPQ